MRSSGWVAVRCVFRSTYRGEQVYEERVTLWRTGDLDDGIRRAEEEALDYAADLSAPGDPTEYVELAQAYLLADELGEGAEVFSLIRESDLSPDAYVSQYFDTGNEFTR